MLASISDWCIAFVSRHETDAVAGDTGLDQAIDGALCVMLAVEDGGKG